MKRIVLNSIAALTAFGLVTATAPKAQAFFIAPAVAAAAMGGALVTGAVLGSASANAQYPDQTVVVDRDGQRVIGPVAWAGEDSFPTFAYHGRLCHPTRAIIRRHWRRIYVCE